MGQGEILGDRRLRVSTCGFHLPRPTPSQPQSPQGSGGIWGPVLEEAWCGKGREQLKGRTHQQRAGVSTCACAP